jgi:hypothetical protein
MGGGGAGFGPSKSDLDRLEKIARETLQEGDKSSKKNVFISFAMEDIKDVNLIRAQAKNEDSELEFNDWSLREPFDSRRAEYVKRGIRERIERCSVTMVYITKNSAGSKWVDWEIKESINLGKGIIAVYKGESPPRSLPASIKEHAIPLVRWSHKGIAAAIDNAAKNR